jgi:pimeloyl-ACP methyl ester carboxylesterase
MKRYSWIFTILIACLAAPMLVQAQSTSAAALDQAIPNSTKVVIPGAGHMANLDKPLIVTRELLTFLLSPSSGAEEIAYTVGE